MYLCTNGVFGGFWRRVLEAVFTSAENFSRRVLERALLLLKILAVVMAAGN
jgi:hypothetical protein